jgi:hypothetical protein
MKRIRLIVLIAAVTAAAAATCAYAFNAGGSFPDVAEGAWYYGAVTRLRKTGVISGFDDGYFHPGETLTAAQFVKMLFYDTELTRAEGDEWWRPYYEAGVAAGMINDNVLSEAAMELPLDRYNAALLLGGLRIKASAPEGFATVPDTASVRAGLADLYSMPPEYREAVVEVCALGLMNGYDDGRFHGEDKLTRAQSAQIMLRLFDESQRSPKMKYISKDELKSGDERFSDALIIGNSLAGGLAAYSGLDEAAYFYCNGVSVYGADGADFTGSGGIKAGLGEILSSGNYGKVLLVFGTNEMASDMDDFYKSYGALIDRVREARPGATVYLNNVPPVNEGMAKSPACFNNDNAVRINRTLDRLARDKSVYLIDVYSVFDVGGSHPREATFDGIHLKASSYEAWAERIRESVY